MPAASSQSARLRLIAPRGRSPRGQNFPASTAYPLVTSPVKIGRDPRCHIVLDSKLYGGVSRQHAEVRMISGSPSGWQICDLDSANGTYVNGYRLQGCCSLKQDDRITLGQSGPLFIFELNPIDVWDDDELPTAPSVSPPISAANVFLARPPAASGSVEESSQDEESESAPDGVTFSQLFPILSTAHDLTRKAYLIPGIITVTFVVLMFVSIGKPNFFNVLLAAYIAGLAYYFVYQLCGKSKPWWVLAGSGLMTALLLISPVLDFFMFIFREVLPGGVPQDFQSVTFLEMLVRMFFGAGLMEELLKAIPIAVFYWLGTTVRSPWRERIGVWEPLDGILLGTASAVGFTLLETLGQYVPNIMNDVAQSSLGRGELVGLQLLIARILGSIAGHMAYSGYLGYFIGLSILKPAKRWQILTVGYLTASGLHALWNTTGIINFFILALVGVISYAFLTAAILKARSLSPTRSQNFATRFTQR